jgi:hypothetical protein
MYRRGWRESDAQGIIGFIIGCDVSETKRGQQDDGGECARHPSFGQST